MNYIIYSYNNVYFVHKGQCVLLYAKSKLIYLLPKTPAKKPQPPFSDRPTKNPIKPLPKTPNYYRQKSIVNLKNNILSHLHPKFIICTQKLSHLHTKNF